MAVCGASLGARLRYAIAMLSDVSSGRHVPVRWWVAKGDRGDLRGQRRPAARATAPSFTGASLPWGARAASAWRHHLSTAAAASTNFSRVPPLSCTPHTYDRRRQGWILIAAAASVSELCRSSEAIQAALFCQQWYTETLTPRSTRCAAKGGDGASSSEPEQVPLTSTAQALLWAVTFIRHHILSCFLSHTPGHPTSCTERGCEFVRRSPPGCVALQRYSPTALKR